MPRVLVVDDDPEIVNVLREFLILQGYEVLTASDGRAALHVLKAHRPHVVLLDIRMPKMNGLEALRQIRAIDQEVNVIMVTGIATEEMGQAALKLAACEFITKPIDLQHLARTLWYTIMEMTL